MRQSILAGIALVATVSVSALILPSSTENENKISVAGRLTYEPWCFCGVDHGIDADETETVATKAIPARIDWRMFGR